MVERSLLQLHHRALCVPLDHFLRGHPACVLRAVRDSTLVHLHLDASHATLVHIPQAVHHRVPVLLQATTPPRQDRGRIQHAQQALTLLEEQHRARRFRQDISTAQPLRRPIQVAMQVHILLAARLRATRAMVGRGRVDQLLYAIFAIVAPIRQADLQAARAVGQDLGQRRVCRAAAYAVVGRTPRWLPRHVLFVELVHTLRLVQACARLALQGVILYLPRLRARTAMQARGRRPCKLHRAQCALAAM